MSAGMGIEGLLGGEVGFDDNRHGREKRAGLDGTNMGMTGMGGEARFATVGIKREVGLDSTGGDGRGYPVCVHW